MKRDPNWRSHCYKCGRFVPAERADIMWIADAGCYEEGYPECAPGAGCNTSDESQTHEHTESVEGGN